MLVVLGFSLFFLHGPVMRLQNAIKEKAEFQRVEREKIKRFHNYTAYAFYGFRLLLTPPEIIAFLDSENADGVLSNIDGGAKLELYRSLFGRSLFKKGGLGFFNILSMLLALIVLLYGYESVENQIYRHILNKRKYLGALFASRALMMAFALAFLAGTGYFYAFTYGVAANVPSFASFLGILFLVLLLFYSIGMLIGTLLRGKRLLASIMIFLVWFFFVFVLPQMVDEFTAKKGDQIAPGFHIEMKKLKVLMDFERQSLEISNRYKDLSKRKAAEANMMRRYTQKEYKVIEQTENATLHAVEKVIDYNHFISMFIPSTFFQKVSEEATGMGYYGMVDFFRKINEVKSGFLHFYVEHKIKGNYKKPIESFIKADENIIQGQSRLPRYFLLGFGLTLFYTMLVFCLSYWFYHSRSGSCPAMVPKFEFPPGENTRFLVCKTENIRRQIFQHYRLQPDTVCIEKINPADFRNGLKPVDLIKHLARLAGVPMETVLKNLDLLGMKKIPKKLTDKDIKRIYVAIMTAGEYKDIVLDDFLLEESQELEKDVFRLLGNLTLEGKRAIYLSIKIYSSAGNLNDDFQLEEDYSAEDMHFSEIMVR